MASLVLLTRAGAMVLVAPARAVEVLGVPCDPAVMVALGAPVVVGELPTLHERACVREFELHGGSAGMRRVLGLGGLELAGWKNLS